MKLQALTTLLFLSVATFSTTGSLAQPQHERRSHRDVLLARAANGELEFAATKRQAGPVAAAAPAPSSSTASSPAPSSSQVASTGSTAPPTTNSAASSAGATGTSSLSALSGSGMTNTSSSQPTPVVPVPAGANGVIALSLISSGMPTGTPSPVVSTYAPGATPSFPGGPALPAQCKFLPLVSSPACSWACHSWCWILVVFNSAEWPAQDKVPDTSESHFLAGLVLGLGTLRCFAQLLKRFKRGWKSSMVSIFLHGRQPPTDRAQVTPLLRGRPVRAVGGRVAGPRATRISPHVRRSWTGVSALMTAQALGVSVPACFHLDIRFLIPFIAQSVFFCAGHFLA
jgi:hypothetical protein